MALIQPSSDYTDRDFDSLRLRVRNLIASAFPEWTDANVANFGNILVDQQAFVGDVLAKYQDAQARECRWSQAVLRQNLLAVAALVGFTPTGATAATVDELFTLSAPQASNVVLPAGTKVSTLEVVAPVQYQLLTALTITAGELTATASVENSEFASDAFTSSGLPNQAFQLSKTPFLEGSLALTAADGTYALVRNFLDSGPSSKHFTVRVDSANRAKVTFGNGVNGSIPSGAISAAYKTGGGAAGRVEASRLKKLVGSFSTLLGAPVTITVTNPQASSGGTDRQTNAQMRQAAPESVRVSDRLIAREDFEIEANKVAGVARTLFLTENEDPGTGENRGILYVVPTSSGVPATPSQALLAAVMAALALKPTASSFRYRAQAPSYLDVNIFAKVYLAKGVTGAQAKASVLAGLGALFSPELGDGSRNPGVDFGFNLKNQAGNPDGTLAWSDVFDAVRDAAGIKKVAPADFTLNGLRSDLALGTRQFPRLGTVQIVDGDTGVTL